MRGKYTLALKSEAARATTGVYVTLALIVARAQNGMIGAGNQIPWHLPQDLKHFKALTLGKPVIMGRRTWDSLTRVRPLPGRTNIVVSRQAGLQTEGAHLVADFPAALALARMVAARDGVDEIFIIGGLQIYTVALPQVQRIYLTELGVDIAGDTVFPALNPEEWQQCAREDFVPSEGNPYPYSFVQLERRKPM